MVSSNVCFAARAACVIEAQPGELLARHIHHGEEAFYVLQGATFETSDGKQITLPTGAAAINHRDVPHAGLKVIPLSNI
jgi:quercetin dioxygenase-like cupin family protein